MRNSNGSIIGVSNVPDRYQASGVYRLGDIRHFEAEVIWPTTQQVFISDSKAVTFDQATHTFTDVEMNVELELTDLVVVAFSGEINNTSGAPIIDSITLNGITATIDIQNTTEIVTVIAVASVTGLSGSTVTVVVNHSGRVDDSLMQMFTLRRFSAVPLDSGFDGVTFRPDITISVPKSAIAICVSGADTNDVYRVLWKLKTETFNDYPRKTNQQPEGIILASDFLEFGPLSIAYLWSQSSEETASSNSAGDAETRIDFHSQDSDNDIVGVVYGPAP